MPSRTSTHLPALTGLRVFLALWVIFGHLVGTGHVYEPIVLALPVPLQAIARSGYLAVPVFFVLSGFVLARTYGAIERTRTSLLQYFTGRFARLYPVYLLSLLIVTPFIIQAKDEPKAWLIAMHLTLTQGWFAGHYTAGWNTPAWSLSCEMFFYAVFPWAVAPVIKFRRGQLAVLAALCCVLPQLMVAAGISDQIKPLFHLPDFVLGIAVSRAFDLLTAGPRKPHASLGPALYLPAAIASALLIAFATDLPKPLHLDTLLRPLNALLLLGLGLGGGLIARLLSTRPVVYLGKSSYSMYILHVPVLWWAVSWPRFAVKYVYVTSVILGSCLVYSWVEEPLNRYLRRLAESSLGVNRKIETSISPVFSALPK